MTDDDPHPRLRRLLDQRTEPDPMTTTEPRTPRTGRPVAGRGRPGRPPIGNGIRIGPYAVEDDISEGIAAHQRARGYSEKAGQAQAARDLLRAGIHGTGPLPEELRARIEAFRAAETFETFHDAVVFLIEDALGAADY